MKIGIIGTGNIGASLARKLSAAGQESICIAMACKTAGRH